MGNLESVIRVVSSILPRSAKQVAEQGAEHARKTLAIMRRERDEARAETWRLREAVCAAAGRPVTHEDAAAWLAARGYPVDRVGMLDVGTRNILLERTAAILSGGGLCSGG